MSHTDSTQSHWAHWFVEIMYFISYPLPMTHMIIGYSGLALSLYLTLVQGHGAAPITVKDKQNIFYCVLVQDERLWHIGISEPVHTNNFILLLSVCGMKSNAGGVIADTIQMVFGFVSIT